jgi:hypothetical protein
LSQGAARDFFVMERRTVLTQDMVSGVEIAHGEGDFRVVG